MVERQTFSRGSLLTYLVCQRRFQLRFLDRLPWPNFTDPAQEQSLRRGQRFHQMLHRRFLGLPLEVIEGEADQELQRWWRIFERAGPDLSKGQIYPEISLTVPVGRHLLTGRFDLLVLTDDRARIFDWKTDTRSETRSRLKADLQTRLYLALAAEANVALGHTIDPDNISLSYWYVNAPQEMVTIDYNQGEHEKNWTELTGLISQIDQQEHFPLTDDLAECQRCLFQIICGRGGGSEKVIGWEPEFSPSGLEPEPL